MKTKLLILVALVGLSFVLIAQNPEGKSALKSGISVEGMPHSPQQRAPLAFLNLTDAQKEAIKKSSLEMHKKIKPVRNELGEAEAHQRTLMTAEKPDIKAIHRNIERIGELKVEIAKIAAAQRLELRGLLTDEQRMKLDMFRERKSSGQGRMAGRPAGNMNRLRFR
jgi:Spy/CpxP family protein refolding chaperone